VEVHYEGRLINGEVFDSSMQRGKSISFGVNKVIKGWTEALQLMKEGARWQIYIPSKLAYGKNGAGNAIGPNETLIFDVELIKVN
jgi:FKBP-type peptidyl-prolyl cis-trans isomerase FklB